MFGCIVARSKVPPIRYFGQVVVLTLGWACPACALHPATLLRKNTNRIEIRGTIDKKRLFISRQPTQRDFPMKGASTIVLLALCAGDAHCYETRREKAPRLVWTRLNPRGRTKPVSEPHAMIRAKPPPSLSHPQGFLGNNARLTGIQSKI